MKNALTKTFLPEPISKKAFYLQFTTTPRLSMSTQQKPNKRLHKHHIINPVSNWLEAVVAVAGEKTASKTISPNRLPFPMP